MSQFKINSELAIMEQEGIFVLTQFSRNEYVIDIELSRAEASVLAQRILYWLASESDRLVEIADPLAAASPWTKGYNAFETCDSIDDNPYNADAGAGAFQKHLPWKKGFDAAAAVSCAVSKARKS